MDLYEFNLKTLKEQTQLVWDHGQFLTLRAALATLQLLYHLGKFFAEDWFDQEQLQIIQVRTFKSHRCLEPYLDKIDLSEVTG